MRNFIKKWVAMITFIILVGGTSVHASPEVLSEGKAWGYHYTVMGESKIFTWKIGNGKKQYHIEENEENRHELDRFRSAVNESDLQSITLFLFAFYLLIIGFVAWINYKKGKNNKRHITPILWLFAMFAGYKCFMAFIHLREALDSAKVYFLVLT
ncbi:hypothetical protein AWM68_18760 [Fictibacillus phosphorivorans]|uniref:Geobacillin-26 family protein n=1 Tax=Fictibacillus phosphorivorans TaxID=1221500 RepID=A0A163RZ98_9BACL|nr:hypothetical protein [Fictibacillus phosphorivorans]KZE67809.1 hypothetical protein AWM68_18760 [Fictibacillus phosphorivorans]